jgi:hypothetical protein
MSTLQKILLFFVLPILGILLYPPTLLVNGIVLVLIFVAMFIGLGVLLLQGRTLALTFSIFLQGMNVIIRLMMFFNNGFSDEGVANFEYIVTGLIGLALSFWLVTRLDKQDVRLTMTR